MGSGQLSIHTYIQQMVLPGQLVTIIMAASHKQGLWSISRCSKIERSMATLSCRSLPEPCMSHRLKTSKQLGAMSSKTTVRTFSCTRSSSAAITSSPYSDSGSSECETHSLEAFLEKYDSICCVVKNSSTVNNFVP